MKVTDLHFVEYEPRYKYPHMGPKDKEIWERFLIAYPGAYKEVAYDVPVGIGTEMDTVVNPETGGDVNKLYQRKIDVVAFNGAQLYVVEVKPRASTASIGQVKGYALLFKRDYAPTQQVRTLIVTDELVPDIEFVAKEEGVEIVVV